MMNYFFCTMWREKVLELNVFWSWVILWVRLSDQHLSEYERWWLMLSVGLYWSSNPVHPDLMTGGVCLPFLPLLSLLSGSVMIRDQHLSPTHTEHSRTSLTLSYYRDHVYRETTSVEQIWFIVTVLWKWKYMLYLFIFHFNIINIELIL